MQRSIRQVVVALGVGALLVAGIAARHIAVAGQAPLPPLSTAEPGADSYPPAARRRGLQGRVLVEFTISPTGRVDDPPTVLAAEPENDTVLPEGALMYMRAARFAVPADWQAAGGPSRKFRCSFVFLLRPCRENDACDEPAPYFGADRWFTITASPIDANVLIY